MQRYRRGKKSILEKNYLKQEDNRKWTNNQNHLLILVLSTTKLHVMYMRRTAHVQKEGLSLALAFRGPSSAKAKLTVSLVRARPTVTIFVASSISAADGD